MKTILFLLSLMFLTSCIAHKESSHMATAYWIGGDGVLVLRDTTGTESYEPVQLKHASKRKLRKLESQNQ